MLCDDCDMEAISKEQPIELSARELKRLVDYLDVLIEMHREYKRNHKESNKDDILLNLETKANQ